MLRVHTCFDHVGFVFLVSSVSSDSYILSPSSSTRLPESSGEEYNRDIPFRVERPKVSHSLHIGCESLYLFTFAAGGSFSDHG